MPQRFTQPDQLVNRESKLWNYFTPELRGLIEDGESLLNECNAVESKISDYSYLVFSFAKAYEGFLKLLFLDMGFIRDEDYYGDTIRIGRILNPYFMKKSDSVYAKFLTHSASGREIAGGLWRIWKKGRNQVFHYFPHNFRRLSQSDAREIIDEFIGAMEAVVGILDK